LPTFSAFRGETERKWTIVAKKLPVHVEPREKGWAVVREGSGRASSVHPTQAEAAKEGREIAQRDETEFFLHARDGRVREHHSYKEGTPSAGKGVVDQAAETVGVVTRGITAPALGALGGTAQGAETDAGREAGGSGGPTNSGSNSGTSDKETSDTEEMRGLTDAERDDLVGMPEERYVGFEVYGQDGERIGKLDDLFVDENDQPEYVGVRTGPLATRSALIPADVVTVDDRLRRLVVSRPRGVVEAGPSLGYDEEVTPELEERVRIHYGLTIPQDTEKRSGYGAYYRDDADLAEREHGGSSTAIPGVPTIPSEAGRVRGREHDREDLPESGLESGLLEDEDEVRVRRSEEELAVGTRERETGAVRVRKRVRTDRERIRVSKKRVDVTVERVPVEREIASTEEEVARPEIGEEEIVIPVVEEEVVVEKRPVIKEEIRIRKEVVEDTEVVEEDVRREEIEVDDETERGQ
jgi:uncharacterized protein (TIGR02271 family)